MKYPDSLNDLIESFKNLPGVGPKTAERFAFHTILKMSDEDVKLFSNNLLAAHNNIKKCTKCGTLTDKEICDICADDTRENTILIVENSKVVNIFEKANEYKGKYHVLNGLISPLNGVGPNDINLDSLFKRIEKEEINKIIIATSANLPGEMTAMFIKNHLSESCVEVYRIGYGIPAGGDIEYADEVTLTRALEGIKKI